MIKVIPDIKLSPLTDVTDTRESGLSLAVNDSATGHYSSGINR